MGNSIVPQVITGVVTGTALDRNNGEAACNAVIDVGALSGGGNTTNFTVVIEESATSTGVFTTIPGMTVTLSAGNQQKTLQGLRTYRWARARVSAITGNSPSVALSVDIIEQAKIAPQSGGYDISPAS